MTILGSAESRHEVQHVQLTQSAPGADWRKDENVRCGAYSMQIVNVVCVFHEMFNLDTPQDVSEFVP